MNDQYTQAGNDAKPAGDSPQLQPPRRSIVRRILLTVTALPAIAYGGLCLLGCTCVNKMMFPAPQGRYVDRPDIIKLTAADGVKISARYVQIPQAKYVVLYSHGNGEDLSVTHYAEDMITAMGLSVLTYDYHGYGTSGGEPSESTVYMDIDAAYDYLTKSQGIAPEQIIVYGRSIGGGPAVDLASRRKVGGLILECAFKSAFSVVVPFPMPFDKFCNAEKISKVSCPVLIIHGRKDMVVPFHHGQRLYELAGEPKQCVWLDDAGHNDIMFIPEAKKSMSDAIKRFITSLATPTP